MRVINDPLGRTYSSGQQRSLFSLEICFVCRDFETWVGTDRYKCENSDHYRARRSKRIL